MNSKTLAMISYITIIGWLVAFFQTRENRAPLVKFHLEQALGLFIVGFLWSVALRILIAIMPVLASASTVLSMLPLVFMVMGIINASKEEFKPLPIFGDFVAQKIKI